MISFNGNPISNIYILENCRKAFKRSLLGKVQGSFLDLSLMFHKQEGMGERREDRRPNEYGTLLHKVNPETSDVTTYLKILFTSFFLSCLFYLLSPQRNTDELAGNMATMKGTSHQKKRNHVQFCFNEFLILIYIILYILLGDTYIRLNYKHRAEIIIAEYL